jgi:ABC-2 type transport system permease protein
MDNFIGSTFVGSTRALLWREVVRFLRQRQRIVGALGTPLVFWLLIGSGMGSLKYFFPGTVVMILLFTAIFSTISIIEDRREGFLQGVLVSPAPRSAIVMGKMLGGTALAVLQGLLFVLCAPLIGIRMGFSDFLFVLLSLFLISFALTGLGFIIAWKLDSTQGFHAIMNLFLMPMWFLSGALFPMTNAPRWLKAVITFNPLTYGVAALHLGFFGSSEQMGLHAPTRLFCLTIMTIFALVCFALSSLVARQND